MSLEYLGYLRLYPNILSSSRRHLFVAFTIALANLALFFARHPCCHCHRSPTTLVAVAVALLPSPSSSRTTLIAFGITLALASSLLHATPVTRLVP